MGQENEKISRLVELIEQHAPNEEINYTDLDDFAVVRESFPHKKRPHLYESMIIIVGQGCKYCSVGSKTYNYSAGHILSVLLPIPLEVEITEASPEKPFLAAVVRVDIGRLANLLLKIENAERTPTQPISVNPSSIFSTRVNDKLLDPIIRLLETLENPRDAAVLSDSIIDEIYYRILVDETTGKRRYLLQQLGEIQRISKAVEHIHKNLDRPVSVDGLARLVHMSRSAFYENFKNVMHISPLQYAKSIKLHKAQTFIQGGKKANEAAYMVGYNSPAQFSREYKRHFGLLPSET